MEAQSLVPAQGTPAWQSGVCDCFNDGSICMQTTFCHICTASNIYRREERNQQSDADCETCCTLWCCSGCSYYTCLPVNSGLTFLFLSGMRRTLIQRYGIQGESFCTSCMMAVCCCLCTTCQVQREMAGRGQHCGGVCATPPQNQGRLPAAPPSNSAAVGAPPPPPPSQQPYDPAAKPGQYPAAPQQGAVVNATPVGPQTAPWGSGLCDCAGAPDCCEAFCCGCCVLGHIGGKLNELHGVSGATGGQLDVCTCVGGYCMPHLVHFMLRRELVERYAIADESPLKSCCCLVWCGPCTLAQTRREMGYRGEFPGGLCLKEAPERSK
uniref:PLAC8 family protein n=1 Tax=Neobodo designis TaxID=312471 RepID=A0A7S1LB35_NEODS|mmetsp:Transcript_18669/g.57869  ORF Transcript_18669/g.57869 Transcript_18669/m.57869 type:complete len:324 (+) Transcript_18669:55-1026(+)